LDSVTSPAQPPSAYEHVLQRARRIRAQKERQAGHPIRHADLGVDRVIPREPIVSQAPIEDERDWHAEALPDHQSHLRGQDVDQSWDEAPLAAEDAWEDQPHDEHALDVASEESGYDEDDFGDELDDEVYAPAGRGSRGGGWLSRFNLRKRGPSLSHDDGMVTRHADWDDWHAPEDEVAQQYVPADRRDDVTAEPRSRWTDAWNVPAQDTAPQEILPHAGFDDAVDELAISYLEDEPEPESRHVAAAEPVRETWHRRRAATELPDLDDNLFDERFDRRASAERVSAAVVAAEASASPRDSWFRAARFRDWPDERVSGHAATHEDVEAARSLPELHADGLDLRELVARGGELLDMTIDIAPDVPRECRTCRSFRSADGGARGWCTNEWAFTHRRMVNEDDLACETSIGCWWLPADRYVVTESEDDYATQTPRIEEMIARRDPAPTRKVSGD
jgi:hypothetical protein